MRAISPVRFIYFSILLLAVGLYPTGLADFLVALGMDARAARIAGSQLTIMAALCGAGFLLIGIAAMARAKRLRRISQMHVALLDHLAQRSGSAAQLVEDQGAVLVGEFDGLRAMISIGPERGGLAVIHASCSARHAIQILPRGLGPDDGKEEVVSSGQSWEVWAEPDGPVLTSAKELLELAFGEVGVLSVIHDRMGIRLEMSNAPADDLVSRLEVGIRLISLLARTNR